MEKFIAIVKAVFSAAHSLPGYKGLCRNLHGHNWSVSVALSRTSLDNIGLSTDLSAIKAALKEIVADLDHCYLNENPNLEGLIPSAENIAKYINNAIAVRFPDAELEYVEVAEGENSSIRYIKN